MAAFKAEFKALVQTQRTVKSQSGYSFNIQEDIWILHGKNLNFELLAQDTTAGFLVLLKTYIAKIVEDKKVSDGTVSSYFTALRAMLHWAHTETGQLVADIDDKLLKAWLESEPGVRYPLSLKTFIQKAQKKNRGALPNTSNEILKTIKAVQSEYLDVLTLDPDNGPWLEVEVLAQDIALEKAYTSGDLSDEKYLIAQLFRRYGPRISQMAHLKVGDILLPGLYDDVADALIRFPWAKANMPITLSPWRPVRADIVQAMLAYLEIRLANIPRREWDNLPFFTPAGLPGVWGGRGGIAKASRKAGFEGHCMPSTMASRFIAIMNRLRLVTHRTGEPKLMSFNPHRERHTIGTRLALQGLSATEIANMLMHTDPVSCEAYVHLGVQHFQLMREKLDVPMTPVAANFLNEPIEAEELFEGEFDVLIARDVADFPVTGAGKCGSCTFKIDGSAPWTCLTCPKFRVFANADLSLLWDELQHRKAYLYNEDGQFSRKYDPSLEKDFERKEHALINAEAKRQEYAEKHNLDEA